MARMIVFKKKRMLPLLEFFRCLMNVISLLQILLYLLMGKHYKDYVLKSDSYFIHEARQLNLHNIIFHNNTTCNYLGALDGTYIRVNVSEADKPRYRIRKNDIATNVLGVCSQDMQFTFVLPGWEGSTADSRVLRDAISRRHGLKVPQWYFRSFYYLIDASCPNGETLKKQCLAIAEMFVNGSGFSWNEDAKMVVVEKFVFDLWVKSHLTAKGLHDKPFPHYDTLLEIFGKDRANGLGATTLA
ncbi:hypothetical protein L1049_001720 [Liquidambar formosana]|uniref:DDE Tnp4 domain-containing protein n=1 Tax=Liquidambar formosana TaxID=63359 RepID=A0AAP0N446_LIQFO